MHPLFLHILLHVGGSVLWLMASHTPFKNEVRQRHSKLIYLLTDWLFCSMVTVIKGRLKRLFKAIRNLMILLFIRDFRQLSEKKARQFLSRPLNSHNPSTTRATWIWGGYLSGLGAEIHQDNCSLKQFMTPQQSLCCALLCFDMSVSIACLMQGEIATWLFQMPAGVFHQGAEGC